MYKIFIISAIILLASPSEESRFLVAALYMTLAITYFSSRKIKNQRQLFHDFYLYTCLLLLGLFFAFPFLEIFRNFSPEKLNGFSLLEYQTGGSFDAYQMFLRLLDVGVVSYGYGFIRAIYFFIPRFFWILKPESSGIEISKLSYLRLENVSIPIIDESYLNFWYFGIIFGPLLIAFLFKKIDTYYLKYSFTKLSLGYLIYFQMTGLAIYNMRGGFLSSFAYKICILLSWFVLILILRNYSFNNNSAR